MTKSEAIVILENGGTLYYRVWYFTKSCMGCHSDDNCCFDEFKCIEDTIDSIDTIVVDWKLLTTDDTPN